MTLLDARAEEMPIIPGEHSWDVSFYMCRLEISSEACTSLWPRVGKLAASEGRKLKIETHE